MLSSVRPQNSGRTDVTAVGSLQPLMTTQSYASSHQACAKQQQRGGFRNRRHVQNDIVELMVRKLLPGLVLRQYP